MVDADDRVAGGLHNDVEVGVEQRSRVGDDRGRAVGDGRVNVDGDLVCRPVDQLEGSLRSVDVDVGDTDDVDAGDVARLGEVHGAEPSGTDETDADGPAVAFALLEEGVKIHDGLPVSAGLHHDGVTSGWRIGQISTSRAVK